MIFSFYSYKGGVGRTQLAVNLASYLCYYQRKKILLIDWDLEAPGLHFYFEGFENVQNKGIVELFTSFVDKMQEVELEAKEEELPQLDESYVVKNVAKSSQHEGKIDLITAGFYDENYKLYNQKANAFNWKEFYDKLDGGNFIELLKKQLKALDYDYVFIDSRTGISDYSGIVNVQIPDVNVLVVAPTNQNFAGALRIAENIKNAPYIKDGNRKPIIMPILSRVDLSIENRSNDWISKFQEKFSLFIKEFCESTNTREREFLNSTILDYKRDLSFGENKLFRDGSGSLNDGTLAKKYVLIANYIQLIKQEYPVSNNTYNEFVKRNHLMSLVNENLITSLFEELENSTQDSFLVDKNLIQQLKREYITYHFKDKDNEDNDIESFKQRLFVLISSLDFNSNSQKIQEQKREFLNEIRDLIIYSDIERNNLKQAIEMLRTYIQRNNNSNSKSSINDYAISLLLSLNSNIRELESLDEPHRDN
jgi:MinD-like ATPase involved in chromosome partitioning or flagellar assembly